MAVEHRSIAVGAVQFHPESIMSLKDELGMRLIAKAVGRYSRNGGGSSLIEPVSIGDVIAADG
jgi:hypothetical protein